MHNTHHSCMDVIERAAPLGQLSRHDQDVLAVLSWNILADCYAMEDGKPQANKHYSHVAVHDLTWSMRCSRILAEIILADADVICLQEVEPDAFERDFLPALSAVGYDGKIQKNDHCVGVATLWHRDKFHCVWETHRSRSLVTVLQEQAEGARTAAVVNVHLQGHARETLARVKQLSSSLRSLSNHGPDHNALVIAGDFNCSPKSACSAYLQFGAVIPGVTEHGQEVTAEVTRVQPHSYSLECVPYRPGGADFTFTTLGARSYCGLLDHIWHTPSSLHCVARRQLFTEVSVMHTFNPLTVHIKQFPTRYGVVNRCRKREN